MIKLYTTPLKSVLIQKKSKTTLTASSIMIKIKVSSVKQNSTQLCQPPNIQSYKLKDSIVQMLLIQYQLYKYWLSLWEMETRSSLGITFLCPFFEEYTKEALYQILVHIFSETVSSAVSLSKPSPPTEKKKFESTSETCNIILTTKIVMRNMGDVVSSVIPHDILVGIATQTWPSYGL